MTPARLQGLQRRAVELLEEFAVNIIDDQKPDIQRSLRAEEFGPFKSEISRQKDEMLRLYKQMNSELISSVKNETSWRKALAANIVAYAVTALLTIVVTLSLTIP